MGGRSTLSVSEIVEGVVADLLPPSDNWVVQPNQLFIVPRNVDVNEVQMAVERMMEEDMLRAADIRPSESPLLSGYASQELNISSLSTMGIWLNNSTGDGLILHYEDGPGQYLPARRNDGTEYQLLFKDAAAVVAQGQQELETERQQRIESVMEASAP